jgi:hypothetical protein
MIIGPLLVAACLFLGFAPQTVTLSAPPAGGAVIWYLGHCGYAVRTQNHLLIFDYQEKRDGQLPKAKPD